MRIIARMNVGGPALQVVGLMRGLQPDRFDHRLYAGSVADDEADYAEACAPDVQVHRVRTLGRRVHAADDARALAELVSAMRAFRPHIVHTHTAKAGALGRVAAIVAGVPARVHTFHGHLLHGYFSPARTRLVAQVEGLLARRTDRLIAVGLKVRNDLVNAGIGRHAQYSVVPPGTTMPPLPDGLVARARLDLPVGVPVIAYVGRVTSIKRPDRLLDVARRVRAARPDAVFVVCGAGDLANALTAAVGADRTLSGGGVRILGWRGDIETVYAAADLTLLTSDNEGTPVSLIESGLAGVPAVTTDVGSVREIVTHGVTGFVARLDADDLSACVLRLLDDDALRRRLGEQARISTELRFGTRRLVDDMRNIYTSIAVDRGWWTPNYLERTDFDEGGGDGGSRFHRGEPVSGAGTASGR